MKKKLLAGLALGVMMFSTVGTVSAAVLDFDTLGTGAFTNYGGFTWTNTQAFEYSSYNSSWSNTLASTSGEMFAFNAFGTMAGLSGGSAFDFEGVYLAGWTQSDAEWYANAHTVTINGYNNGTLVDTYGAQLTLGAMTYFNVAMNNVDQLEFSGDSGRWFLMDNFTYNSNNSVPEPATMLLFGTGLAGLVGARLRRKK